MMRSVRCLLAASAFVFFVAACGPVKKGPPVSLTLACTDASQSWTVPAGVHFITASLFGAEGGSFQGPGGPAPIPGGRGGGASATLAVTPGESLQVNVGCAGQSTEHLENPGSGGFGGGPGGDGGGPRSAGGGGGTDLRRGVEVLLAAGGGGGGGGGVGSSFAYGGAGGGATGEAGGPGASGVTGGGGGTQSGGGAAGSGCIGGPTAGALGQGGDGGDGPPGPTGGGGGGGGGGYYGGGGGCDGWGSIAGGGGGGSGFGPPGAMSETGVWSFGDGVVLISYRTSS